MAAGWLILAIVDILWVLYFTSEEDSLVLHIFNSLGTGGLSPPSRRRRTRGPSVHNMSSNGYAANFSAGGGIASQDVPYDPAAKAPPTIGSAAVRSQNSFVGTGSIDGATRNLATAAPLSVHGTPPPPPGQLTADQNPTPSPLVSPGAAGVGAGTALASGPSPEVNPEQDSYTYKAKALYACSSPSSRLQRNIHTCFIDTASPDDPNEISFVKGEILDILDKQGKWWQAKKTDGAVGSESRPLPSCLALFTVPLVAPSNYLQII